MEAVSVLKTSDSLDCACSISENSVVCAGLIVERKKEQTWFSPRCILALIFVHSLFQLIVRCPQPTIRCLQHGEGLK